MLTSSTSPPWLKLPGTRRNGGRRKSPRAKPARGAPGKMSARRHLKYYLKVYLVLTKLSNGFADVLRGKWLAFGVRMRVFPKWAKSTKEFERAIRRPLRSRRGKSFLQGLKPIRARRFTPGPFGAQGKLKPRPPKERNSFRKLPVFANISGHDRTFAPAGSSGKCR
jgi:hypothetical protein